jgi:hypothetical protein
VADISTDDLRVLLAEAVAGPWYPSTSDGVDRLKVWAHIDIPIRLLCVASLNRNIDEIVGDSRAAPTMRLMALAPELVEEVLALRAEVELLRALVLEWRSSRHWTDWWCEYPSGAIGLEAWEVEDGWKWAVTGPDDEPLARSEAPLPSADEAKAAAIEAGRRLGVVR